MNISGRDFAIFSLVVIGVLIFGMLILGLIWVLGGLGGGMMMQPHMWGPDMMGPRMTGGANILGLLFFCLAPLGLIGLLVAGLIWLAVSRTGGREEGRARLRCPNCDREVQSDWANCPYCSTPLREGDAS